MEASSKILSISSFRDHNQMKKFIFKTLLFLSPLLLIGGLNLFFLTNYKELLSVEELSEKKGSLIGLAYSDPVKEFKYRVLSSRQPEILALGTSRVLQFRGFYFTEPKKFYNGGRSVDRIKDVESFLKNYPGVLPKTIILGLDQNFFSEAWDDTRAPGFNQYDGSRKFIGRLHNCSKEFTDDLLDLKVHWTPSEVSGLELIGLTALSYHEGFRDDGSYMYGRRLLLDGENYKYNFSSTLKRIKKQKSKFKASAINREAIAVFENILKLCQTKKIRLITFLPPYAHTVYEELRLRKDEYPYVFKLHNELLPLCIKYGSVNYDFSDLKSINSNDYETIDGFHGSETAYLKIAQKLFENEEDYRDVIDPLQIKAFTKKLHSARQILPEVKETKPQQPQPLF